MRTIRLPSSCGRWRRGWPRSVGPRERRPGSERGSSARSARRSHTEQAMALDGLLSRDEVLGGLPAKRAATLLYLIESRTRYLAAARRREFERFVTEEAAQDRENAFFDAFRRGRGAASEATIQEIER